MRSNRYVHLDPAMIEQARQMVLVVKRYRRRAALDYLIKVREYGFVEAAEALTGITAD